MRHILLSNDDGYNAYGLISLYKKLKKKYRVTVCAPKTEMSGSSHSFTFKGGLTYDMEKLDGIDEYFYNVSGKPSDCVKFALGYIIKNDLPDLVISGINHGLNTGIASFYSGTVAAAREGAFWRIPSVSFSLSEEFLEYMDIYSELSIDIIENYILESKIKGNHFFNVNYPKCKPEDIKGREVTRQSLSYYKDFYTEDNKRFFLGSTRELIEENNTFDIFAVENGYISVTPMSIDNTCDRYYERTNGAVYGK